jgi:hypothetical protein
MAVERSRAQYMFDREGLAGPPALGWYKHNYDAGGALLGLHFSNLFDQPADESGEYQDLATGEPYTVVSEELPGMTIREIDSELDDILGPLIP